MNILKYNDAIQNCRFCFMCRHLSGVANVTFSEADTPRVRAAAMYTISNKPEELASADFIRNMYDSDLSKACTYHCVSHYPETDLVLAARRDIVEAGLAPANVKALADEFEASAGWSVKGTGNVLYFEDRYTAETPAIAKNFARFAGGKFRTVTGGCIGRALCVLGYADRSKKVAERFTGFVHETGAKTLVVSNPAAYDMLMNVYKEYGVKLKVKAQHSSEFILGLKKKFKPAKTAVYYLESDFLKNYAPDYPYPHKLLKELGVELKPFGTNNEESYSAGEGAVLLPRLNECLVKKLAARVESRADDPEKDLLVTASPYTRYILPKYTKLNVITLEELAGGLI
jgi:Fe-S oxidoreductase